MKNQNIRQCAVCGRKSSPKDNFCQNCGNALSMTVTPPPSQKKKPFWKKPIFIVGIILTAIIIFSSNNCSHELTGATCSTPQTCTECGKTKGSAIDHQWKEATCTDPKTCEYCAKTDGEALGHNWEGDSCTEARVCNRCSFVDKDSVGHDWIDATYEKPKTCAVCGITEGSPLINYQGTTKYVVEGYESALSYAKMNGYEADYAYNDTRERLVKINSAAYMNDTNAAQWAAFQVILGDIDTMSCSQLQKKAQTAMEFIVPESSDRFSALMKKFKKMSSVSGIITTTEVDIVVNDMDAFVKELGLTDKIVGGVLAILNLYDYSWIDPNTESALQFTENGFIFHWKAVGDYKLSLN